MPGMRGIPVLHALSLSNLLMKWQLHAGVLAVLVGLAVGYAWLVVRARRQHVAWSGWRSASWAFGLVVAVLATQGGIAVYGQVLFWIHMVGHLMLIMVAPHFLALGSPLTLLTTAYPELNLDRSLSRGPLAVLSYPLTGLVAYSATIMLTHLTGFMNAMMLNPWLASAEDLLYLTAGLLFFLPLLGSEPIGRRIDGPQRIFLLFLAMPVDTFTGLVLAQTNHYPWPAMAAMHQAWAPSLLADLHGGGAVMWVGGDAIMALVMGGCFLVWARAGAQATAGNWLEGVRLRTLQGATGSVAFDAPTADTDAHLAAYNDYLQTLSRAEVRASDRPADDSKLVTKVPGTIGGPAPTIGP